MPQTDWVFNAKPGETAPYSRHVLFCLCAQAIIAIPDDLNDWKCPDCGRLWHLNEEEWECVGEPDPEMLRRLSARNAGTNAANACLARMRKEGREPKSATDYRWCEVSKEAAEAYDAEYHHTPRGRIDYAD